MKIKIVSLMATLALFSAGEAIDPTLASAGWCGGGGRVVRKAPRPVDGGGVIQEQAKHAVAWYEEGYGAWMEAKYSKKPLILYFAGEDEDDVDAVYADETAKKLGDESAVFVFIRVFKPLPAEITGEEPVAEDAKEEKAKSSLIPIIMLDEEDMHKAYGVSAGAVVVADSFGNPIKKFSTKPSSKSLVEHVENAKKQATKNEESLQKNLDKAKAALEKSDTRSAIRYLTKVFKENMRGYKPAEAAVEEYESLVASGTTLISTAAGKHDVEALKRIAADYQGTEVADSANTALAGLKAKEKK